VAQGKSRTPRAQRTRDRDVQIDIKKLYGLNQSVNSVQQVSSASQGSANQSPNQPTSGSLKVKGDTMIGPIAFFPNAITVATGAIDIGVDSDKYTSYIIVSGEGAVDDDLVTITGAAFSGQLLYLQAITTTKITLTNADNIITPDGMDFDVEAGNVVSLVFDPTISSGKWRVLTAGVGAGSAGANTALSNLANPTAINQSLEPNADDTHDLGKVATAWQNVWTHNLQLTSVEVATAGARELYGDAGGVVINVPTGTTLTIQHNGVDSGEFTNQTIQGWNNLILNNQLDFNDNAADPGAFAGEFARNGADMKVYSGGAVRNFSDIGAAAGANLQLSNLAATVAVNLALDPTSDGLLDLGISGKSWNDLSIDRIIFRHNDGVSDTNPSIGRSSNALRLNTPTANEITLEVNGISQFQVELDKVTLGGATSLSSGLQWASDAGSILSIVKTGSVAALFSCSNGFKFDLGDVEFGTGGIVIADAGNMDFNAKTIIDIGNITMAAAGDLLNARNIDCLAVRYEANPTDAKMTLSATGTVHNVGSGESHSFDVAGLPIMTLVANNLTIGPSGGVSVILNDSLTLTDLTDAFIDFSDMALGGVGAPAANFVRLFVDSADGEIKVKKSDSTVVSLEGAGGGLADKILEGNSSVEVIDSGTGSIVFEVDGINIASMAQSSGLTMIREINMGGQNIVNMDGPNSSGDAATKGYVDGLVGGSFPDDSFEVTDDITPSKVAKFQASSIGVGVTRTFTFPNVNGILATINNAQTVTGANVFTASTFVVNSSQIFLTNTTGDQISVPGRLDVTHRLQIPSGNNMFG